MSNITQIGLTQIRGVAPFNFAAISGGVASGNLTTSGAGKVITLRPMPFGLAVNNVVYISGGTGVAETVTITVMTGVGGDPVGTITVTTAQAHTGNWTVGSASSGIQEALTSAGAPAWILLPSGPLAIHGPIKVPGGGYRLTGQGQRATILNVAADFPLTALGVFVFAGPLSFAQVEEMTVRFIQPDSTSIGDYTHWPPAFYAQGAPYFRLSFVETDLPWVSIDARANGSGCTIDNCQLGGFGWMARFAILGDTVRVTNVHNVTGFSATSNNVTAFMANAIGIENVGTALHVTNFLTLANIGMNIKAGDGGTFVSNTGFDSNNGIRLEGGFIEVSNSYFSVGGENYALLQTGGDIIINSADVLGGNDHIIPPFIVSNDAGGTSKCLLNNLRMRTAAADVTCILVNPSAGALQLILTNSIIETTPTTLPVINLATNTAWATIIGNVFLSVPAGHIIIDVAFAPVSGGRLVIHNNAYNGGTVRLPANPFLIDIDTGLPTYGGSVASATSITPSGQIFQVSGTTSVETIVRPAGFVLGQFTILPTGALPFGVLGNIANALTATAGVPVLVAWDVDAAKFRVK